MKTQFGKQQLNNVTTVSKNGLGVVVAAEGYRGTSNQDPASERLSRGCAGSTRSMRSLRQDEHDRLRQSICASWRSDVQRAVPAIDPGATTITALPAAESRLPAPAWAAFVLSHALCG